MSDLINPSNDEAFFPTVVCEGAVTTQCAIGNRAVCKSNNGLVTVDLQAGPVDGSCIIVEDTDGQADDNNITINGNGETIDGASTLVLAQAGEIAVLVYDAGEWRRAVPERLIPGTTKPYTRGNEAASATGSGSRSGAFDQDMLDGNAVLLAGGLAAETIIVLSTPDFTASRVLSGFRHPDSLLASYKQTIWNNQAGAFAVEISTGTGTTALVPQGETWEVQFTPAGAQLVGA